MGGSAFCLFMQFRPSFARDAALRAKKKNVSEPFLIEDWVRVNLFRLPTDTNQTVSSE